MTRRKLISFVVVLALAAGALAPLTVRGDRLTDEMTTTSRATDEADDTTRASVAAQDAQSTAAQSDPDTVKPKRQGNSLGRVLSAPFRALARLFGGGKKNAKQAAKKRDANADVKATPPVVAAARTNDDGAKKNDEKTAGGTVERAGVVSSRPSPSAALPAPSSVPSSAPSSAEVTRVVRPAEERLMPRPGAWVPVIEGIPKDPLSQGRALLHHGYVSEAISELSVAAARADNLVEANNLLGLAYDRLGWHRMAVEAYERALSVAPNDAVVLANLGYSHYLDSNYAASVKRLRQAARRAPATTVIHNNLGVALASAGKFGDAFNSFKRAGGEYEAHVKLAGILETAKRDRDAAKHYEAALRLQPGTNAVLERLVAIYERTGERTKADTARRTLGRPKNEQKTTTGGG